MSLILNFHQSLLENLVKNLVNGFYHLIQELEAYFIDLNKKNGYN